jgi:hypothetical protein
MSSWSSQGFAFMCVMAGPLISLEVFYKPEYQASFFLGGGKGAEGIAAQESRGCLVTEALRRFQVTCKGQVIAQ